MTNRIASITIDRQKAVEALLNRDRLYITRGRSDGPLHQLITWIKDEEAREYTQSNVRIGKQEDDFVLSYYNNGRKITVGRDGKAYISGADADKMHQAEEKELQNKIDSILANEIIETIVDASKNMEWATGKRKALKTVDPKETMSPIMILGVSQ